MVSVGTRIGAKRTESGAKPVSGGLMRLGDQAPAAQRKIWRSQVPQYIEGMDETFNRRYEEMRNGLIETAVECRKNVIAVDGIMLWATDGRGATVPRPIHTPEVRVLIELARQYERLREVAEECLTIKTKLMFCLTQDETDDPKVVVPLTEQIDAARKDYLAAQKVANHALDQVRDTAIKVKTMAMTTLKYAEATLQSLIALAQGLLVQKQKMELTEAMKQNQREGMSDAELVAALPAPKAPPA